MFMGDDQNRCAHGVDLGQKLDDLVGKLGVDVAGRLVGDDDLGIIDQRARQTDALLLTARKLRGLVLHLVLQAHQIEHIRHALFDRGSGFSDRAHRESDVIEDVHLFDESEVLKNDAHMAAQIRHVALFQLAELVAVDGDLT